MNWQHRISITDSPIDKAMKENKKRSSGGVGFSITWNRRDNVYYTLTNKRIALNS